MIKWRRGHPCGDVTCDECYPIDKRTPKTKQWVAEISKRALIRGDRGRPKDSDH